MHRLLRQLQRLGGVQSALHSTAGYLAGRFAGIILVTPRSLVPGQQRSALHMPLRHLQRQAFNTSQGDRRQGLLWHLRRTDRLAAAIALTPSAPLGTITQYVQVIAGVLLPSAILLLLLCNDKPVLGPCTYGLFGAYGAILAVALARLLVRRRRLRLASRLIRGRRSASRP
jgi:hypothetical protein